MIVKLPRKCTGQEIAVAFDIAATHLIDDRQRWKVVDRKETKKFDLATSQLVPYSVTLSAHPRFSRRQWFICGKMVWVTSRDQGIRISDLVLDKEYEEVALDTWFMYDEDQGGVESYCHDPASPDFAPLLPAFNEIMGRLACLLKPKEA